MEQIQFQDTYPVYKLAMDKGECRFASVAEIAAHLKAHLDEPAHVARTVNAVFQNTELLSEETASKKRVTPARPRAPFA